MSITKEKLFELCKTAAEILEEVNFKPYFVEFWGSEIWMQGDHNSELEEKLIENGFEWKRSFKKNGSVFLVFKKHNIEIMLVRQY